jgi:hypothetical protein
MKLDRSTHQTRVELDIHEALKVIQLLSTAVQHAMAHQQDSFEMCAMYKDNGRDIYYPGSVVYLVNGK